MQPDYSTQVKGLFQQWYEAAKNDVGYNEEMQLYQNNDQVVKTLQELKNSGQLELVKKLSNIVTKKFNNLSADDSKLLAKWVARHTKIDKSGAFQAIQQLFLIVTDTNDHSQTFTTHQDNFASAGNISNLLCITNIALDHLETDLPSFPNISEIQKLIISNLDHKSARSLGITSKRQNELSKSHLIDLLNAGEIVIKDLGFKSITQIINYFGKDNCSKIIRLNLTDVYPKEVSPELSPNYRNANKKYSNQMETVNLSESFPCLKHFILSNYRPQQKLDLNELHLPKNLESLVLSGCRDNEGCGITAWNSIEDLTSLKELGISNNYLKDSKLSFLNKLSELEKIDLSYNQLSNPTILKEKQKLKNLNLQNNLYMEDISFIKECPLLTEFYFGNYYKGTEFANLSHLQECPSLTSLHLASIHSIENEFLDFLKLPNLEHLSLADIENPDFLSACTSLKSLTCSFENLEFLAQCPNITKLTILSPEDLDDLPDLEKLEEIELAGYSLGDLSALEKLPLLKKVVLTKCNNVSDEHIKALISKGITVIKKETWY